MSIIDDIVRYQSQIRDLNKLIEKGRKEKADLIAKLLAIAYELGQIGDRGVFGEGDRERLRSVLMSMRSLLSPNTFLCLLPE